MSMGELEVVCSDMTGYIERAMFVCKEQSEEMNTTMHEKWALELNLERAIKRAEIIFDYLWMLQEEVKKFDSLLDEANKQKTL